MTEPSDTCDSPDMSAPERQRLVEEHAPMVRQIAHGMLKELPHSVREDDLVQDGLLGLLDAILRANKAMTAQQFRSFAAQRIRGAVLDGLRAADWGSRRVRRAMRNIEITTQQLGHQLGRAPSESEVAAALGIPLASYQHTLQPVSYTHLEEYKRQMPWRARKAGPSPEANWRSGMPVGKTCIGVFTP